MVRNKLEWYVVTATKSARRGVPDPRIGFVSAGIDRWRKHDLVSREVWEGFREALLEAGVAMAAQERPHTTRQKDAPRKLRRKGKPGGSRKPRRASSLSRSAGASEGSTGGADGEDQGPGGGR